MKSYLFKMCHHWVIEHECAKLLHQSRLDVILLTGTTAVTLSIIASLHHITTSACENKDTLTLCRVSHSLISLCRSNIKAVDLGFYFGNRPAWPGETLGPLQPAGLATRESSLTFLQVDTVGLSYRVFKRWINISVKWQLMSTLRWALSSLLSHNFCKKTFHAELVYCWTET